MKTIVKALIIALIMAVLGQCKKDSNPYVTIPDNSFLNALIKLGVDKNGDDIISTDEAALVHFLDVSNHNISDLKGIEAFVNLDTLYCLINNLTSLDVSKNTALTYLDCYSNQLTSLDVSNNTDLINLFCGYNPLTRSLDVSTNTALTEIECSGTLACSK